MSQLLLVRHGQASWGGEDYDVLSELGEHQSGLLGRALAARGVRPQVMVHGAMRRQRETARLLADAAGWPDAWAEDADWDEMDHEELLGLQPHTFHGDAPTAQEFRAWFEAATERWAGGRHDTDYEESFPAFTARVLRACEAVLERLDPGGTAVVVTSGGPIARIAADRLGGGADLHGRIAPVVVNASVTKLVRGRRGSTLVSFNDHGHLESPQGGLVSYR